ncbi:MAG: 16S rRNA (adenine(1518)-N(6)/adenine(1519)-N(6))-dimethyltransferase RsmA [Erysipelotrichaceae bacterium]
MTKPIASIARTNEILKKYDLFPKKQYGQNFIIEPMIVVNIAKEAIQDEQSCAIEIGPGIGALTQQLAEKASKVIAFEVDMRLQEVLADTLSDYDNVQIIFEDFLNIDLDAFLEEVKKEYSKIYFAANLPYYITTPILFKIFESKHQVEAITVMMQKEVADRFSAKVNSKDYNALSIIVQYLYNVKVVLKIPKTIFNPKPNVDSSVVRFTQKENSRTVSHQEDFFEMVKGAFKQRRKTLYNNLRAYYQEEEKARQVILKAGFKESVRAQELSLDDFIHLFEVSYES